MKTCKKGKIEGNKREPLRRVIIRSLLIEEESKLREVRLLTQKSHG